MQSRRSIGRPCRQTPRCPIGAVGFAILLLVAGLPFETTVTAESVAVDFSGYQASCGVIVARDGEQLIVGWPIAEGEHAWMFWRWPTAVRWNRLFTIVR